MIHEPITSDLIMSPEDPGEVTAASITPDVRIPARPKFESATKADSASYETPHDSTFPYKLTEKKRIRAEALAAYRDTAESVKKIGTRFGRSAATIVIWAKEAGLPGRRRGRLRRTEPTDKQKWILNQVGTASLSVLGKRIGCSRQAIHALARCYPHWVRNRPNKGTVATFRNEPRAEIPIKDSVISFRLTRDQWNSLKVLG